MEVEAAAKGGLRERSKSNLHGRGNSKCQTRELNNVENTQTRLEEVLPILDSLHLLGGELEPLGGLEDQHNRRTKAKLANLMK